MEVVRGSLRVNWESSRMRAGFASGYARGTVTGLAASCPGSGRPRGAVTPRFAGEMKGALTWMDSLKARSKSVVSGRLTERTYSSVEGRSSAGTWMVRMRLIILTVEGSPEERSV